MTDEQIEYLRLLAQQHIDRAMRKHLGDSEVFLAAMFLMQTEPKKGGRPRKEEDAVPKPE